MFLTLFGAGLILLFTILGYYRGVLRILAAFASLFVAAFAAPYISSPFRTWLESASHVPKALIPLAALFCAGILIFLAAIIVAEFVLASRQRKRLEQDLPALPSWERWSGALLGGAWGLGLVLLIFIGIDIIGTVEEAMTAIPKSAEVQAPSEPTGRQFADWRKDMNQSMFGPLVHQVNPVDEKVSRTFRNLTVVISDPVLFDRFQNHPTVAKLATDPRIMAIAEDPEIQHQIQDQDFYRLLDNQKIAALLEDNDLFYTLKDVDMDAILREIVQDTESNTQDVRQ